MIAVRALTILGGCMSLSPQGQGVRVVRTANYVKDCQSLGEVESVSGVGHMAQAGGFSRNQTLLKNKTAALGGDAVLITSERAGMWPHTIGEAFRCAATAAMKP